MQTKTQRLFSWRRTLFGSPLSRHLQMSQKLSNVIALPIFSSDALSSVAYATEEMLNVLVLAGVGALSYVMHISILIVLLVLIVGMSYRQAIQAYPKGGGAYTVSRDNFGVFWSLIAAAALMIDYILTVAVSVTAGVRAMTSAFPALYPHAVLLSIIAVVLVMWMNLRGVKESGRAFALPTYAFVVMILLLIVVGGTELLLGHLHPVVYHHSASLIQPEVGGALTTVLILRAFSSGCSALTGIEAVSNGVPAFRTPSAENAMKTLLYLMILLIVMFVGISLLASVMHIRPSNTQSVLSQIAEHLWGHGFMYYCLQVATCLVLLLAANTSFAGFPLLASMISRHGFLPRQLMNVGDRLAFSNGILVLGIAAIVLIVAFNAETHALIPLYSIGVFLAFTLCQAGLVKVWFKRRAVHKNWWLKGLINGVGCLTTAVAVVVIAESKFTEGAWLFFLAMPVLLFMFYRIRHHYRCSDRELAASVETMPKASQKLPQKVIVPVSKLHRGTLEALAFARSLSPDVTAVAINTHSDQVKQLKADWQRLGLQEKLVILESPYQSTISPLLTRIQRMDKAQPERGLTTVVVPKALPKKWWHYVLHNHKTLMLRIALATLSRRDHCGNTRVFVEVPYQLAC